MGSRGHPPLESVGNEMAWHATVEGTTQAPDRMCR
jgi:hypothetical protein